MQFVPAHAADVALSRVARTEYEARFRAEDWDDDQDRARLIVGGKAMIRSNIALNVEFTTYTDGAKVEEGIDNTLFVLLSAGF